MRNRLHATIAVHALMVSAVLGCSVAPSDEAQATVTEEIQGTDPAERTVIQLPLRSEDLVDMAAMEAMLNAECPAPTTCAGFGSCASWSATTSCGAPSCGSLCIRCLKPGVCSNGIKQSTFSSRFRVCFNAQQQACTEFQVSTQTVCQVTGECCDLSPGVCGPREPI